MKKILVGLLIVIFSALVTVSAQQTCGGYDFNNDGEVNLTELEEAIQDYNDGYITDNELEEAINCYSGETPAHSNPWDQCGDLDKDGDWDFDDLLIILGYWKDPGPWPADLDCDGIVTVQDILLFLNYCMDENSCHYCCPEEESEAVPALTPIGLVALAGSMGLVATVMIRRR